MIETVTVIGVSNAADADLYTGTKVNIPSTGCRVLAFSAQNTTGLAKIGAFLNVKGTAGDTMTAEDADIQTFHVGTTDATIVLDDLGTSPLVIPAGFDLYLGCFANSGTTTAVISAVIEH